LAHSPTILVISAVMVAAYIVWILLWIAMARGDLRRTGVAVMVIMGLVAIALTLMILGIYEWAVK